MAIQKGPKLTSLDWKLAKGMSHWPTIPAVSRSRHPDFDLAQAIGREAASSRSRVLMQWSDDSQLRRKRRANGRIPLPLLMMSADRGNLPAFIAHVTPLLDGSSDTVAVKFWLASACTVAALGETEDARRRA